jgi:hypothetical protein
MSEKIVNEKDGSNFQPKRRLTKRAPDKWDSAAFFSSFLASSFFCSQIESTPAPAPVTQTVETVEKVGDFNNQIHAPGFYMQRTLWQNTNQAMKIK